MGTYIMLLSISGNGKVKGKNGGGQAFESGSLPISIPTIRVLPPDTTAKNIKNHEMAMNQIKSCEKSALLAAASKNLKFVLAFDDGSWNGQDKCAPGFRCSPTDDAGNLVDAAAATKFTIGDLTLDPNSKDWGFTFFCGVQKK